MSRHQGGIVTISRVPAACAAIALCLAAFVALTAGCGSPVDLSRADIRGTIKSVTPSSGGSDTLTLGSILIEGTKEKDTSVDKASVTVTAKTRIYRLESGKPVKAGFDALAAGERAQAIFTGPVLESYPVQATASEIVVLSGVTVSEVKDKCTAELMVIKGVVGVGIGEQNGLPCIKVFLENGSAELKVKIPKTLEGYRVVTEVTGPIKAL
jgi:hypothetical protein